MEAPQEKKFEENFDQPVVLEKKSAEHRRR